VLAVLIKNSLLHRAEVARHEHGGHEHGDADPRVQLVPTVRRDHTSSGRLAAFVVHRPRCHEEHARRDQAHSQHLIQPIAATRKRV